MERKADRRGAGNSAFYEPPSCLKKTSVEIISEARAAVMRVNNANGSTASQTSAPANVTVVRPVNTKRPYTPRDSQRTLFGRAAGTQFKQRPPSAFSLSYLQNQDGSEALDTVLPGKRSAYVPPMLAHRESPDPLRGMSAEDALGTLPGWARLPSIASLSKLRTGRGLATATILANLPEELESADDSSAARSTNASALAKNTTVTRKAYSSPREKTEQLCQPNDAFGPPVLLEDSSGRDVIMFEDNVPGGAVDGILQELMLMSGSGDNDADSLILIRRLYSALRRNQLGKYSNVDDSPEDNKGSSARQGKLSKKGKAHILKTLYRFVDRQNDELLLAIARIILLLKTSGNNLSGACKLVFKVSRNDKNDVLFMDSNILDLFMEALGRASPLEDAEACVYGYGALKFLTMNIVLLNNLLRLGALDLMVLHLKIVAAARAEGSRIPEQTNHAVFQLTGALRNVAGEERALPLLVSRGAIAALCRTMELFAGDLDLITNIARTLSIVSTSEECCRALVEFPGCVPLMAKLLEKYPGRQDIVVRLGYALGNLLAHSDKARLLMIEANGAMDSLLDVLDLYLQKDLQHVTSPNANDRNRGNQADQSIGSDGSIEDVLVKIIRIIANMCMNSDVGYMLACNKTADGRKPNEPNRNGERTLDLLLTVLQRKTMQESGELVLSALSTLNNLSYYPSGDEPSVFQSKLAELSKALGSLLRTNETECLVETTKVLGNVTRCRMARDILLDTGGLEKLLFFLESNNTELLSTTTGVLVNIMADRDKREAFRRTNGIERLVSVLQRSDGDWPLASLVCQVLWNFCVDAVHIDEWLGPIYTNTLLETLIDYLDEERQFDEIGQPSNNFQQWEDFAVIASDFVEKIESFLEKSQAADPNMSWPPNSKNTGVREDLSSNLSS